jgi:uncharacterized protein YdhG (YjbR/CyaY superfamily)
MFAEQFTNMEAANKFKTVDEYLSSFPADTGSVLRKMRTTIKEVVPDAEELISYNMPAFKLHGVLVWYAAYKNHIGLYPTSSAIKTFAQELSMYKTSKGAIQFPIDEPIPTNLVKKIVKFRVKQDSEKAMVKKLR